ncbi:CLUMA_CG014828, isoform A [Clunio marinus]|uniref:CLUMA_CG014828, isoform A n=1 Tax=Clunio marinus TaxID=568069 RepID=A0A1J1IR70_9DIPT|nr:CLUMA_CG014828, isoform A [Clunio marinus]
MFCMRLLNAAHTTKLEAIITTAMETTRSCCWRQNNNLDVGMRIVKALWYRQEEFSFSALKLP